MDAQRFDKLKELFESALKLHGDARRAFIDGECGHDEPLGRELQALIAAAEATIAPDDPLAEQRIDAQRARLDELQAKVDVTRTAAGATYEAAGAPERIGPFRILSTIGQGGMGTVYEAEQDSPRRTVALKVIRAGLASSAMLKRFALESQVLGRLQHPGIAQIYQAGTAETPAGQLPYFAMEYVRGVDVRRHVERRDLDTRARLELLERVCEAVHHAHQQGVIHRDLKPGNILVDASGQPKILDFGVARATDADLQVTTVHTDIGQLIGTLQYMSPEQVAADPDQLDTRSDVYALGVIAYELLTGQTPYDLKNKMIHEAARIIREQEPTSASSINRVFRGDIETIVAKALEKSKNRRYQSAAGMADDIRRFLDDQPILARPPSAMYQLRKLARRNKALAGGIGVAIAALLIGFVTSTSLWFDAEAARAGEEKHRKLAEGREAEAVAARLEADAARTETEKRAEELKTVTEFQKSMLGKIDAESMGLGILSAQREDIQAAMKADGAAPATSASALATFDDIVSKVNSTNLALRVIDRHVLARAADTISADFADQPVTRAALQQTVAGTYLEIGLNRPARPLLEACLQTRRETLGPDHQDTVEAVHNMGYVLEALGLYDEALPYYTESLDNYRRVLGNDHPDTLASINNMGALLRAMGKPDEAEPFYREALDGCRRVLGNDHRKTLSAINNMTILMYSMGKRDEAAKFGREALEGRLRVFGEDHPDTLKSYNNMGFLLKSQGKLAEAETYYRKALEGRRRVLGDDHPSTLSTMTNMGGLLVSQGKLEEAESYLQADLERSRKVLGNDHPDTLKSINNMAKLLKKMQRYDEARALFEESVTGRRRVLGPEHPDTLSAAGNMGLLLLDLGRFEEAQGYLKEAWKGQAASVGPDHERTIATINLLIRLYDAWHEAQPDRGHDAAAAEWRSRLPAEDDQ